MELTDEQVYVIAMTGFEGKPFPSCNQLVRSGFAAGHKQGMCEIARLKCALESISAICEKYQNMDFPDHDFEEIQPVAFQLTMNVLNTAFIALKGNTPTELWCIHIEGPDDIIAMRTKEKAETEAAKINAFIKGQPDFDDDPHCEAKVILYPGSAENHARAVEDNEREEREALNRKQTVRP